MISSKGQAMIEALFCLPFFISIGGGFLIMFYYEFSKLALRSHLQEAILCLQNNNPVSLCQFTFTSQLEENLPIGKIEKILLEKTPLSITGKALFSMSEDLQIEEVQELALPFSPFSEVSG